MNLGVTAGPLSNQYRASVMSLAEPERSKGLKWNAWLLGYFVAVTVFAAHVLSLYFAFVL